MSTRSDGLESGTLEALLENARLLHGSLELDELLGSLLRTVMGRLAVSRALICLAPEPAAAEDPGPPPEGPHVVAVSRGFKNLAVGSQFEPELCAEAGVAHLFAIGDPENPIGNLAIGRPLAGDPGPRELAFLDALLGIAASAIANARAHARARRLNRALDRRVQQLHTLLDLSQSLSAAADANRVAQILGLTFAGQWRLARWAVVAMKEGQPKVERCRGLRFPDAAALVPALATLAGPTLTAALPPGPLADAVAGQDAALLAPMRTADRVIGFFVLGAPGGGAFGEEDLELLSGLAAQGANAFENAWSFAETLTRQRLERDLSLASEIQQRLFPTVLPQPPGWRLAARNRPAQRVGGDYYDVLSTREAGCERHLVCVADVSGKGIAASLLMSNVQATLRALFGPEVALADLVERTNRLIFATTPASKYVTAFFLLFDPVTGACRYVNAGHNEALVVRGDGSVETLKAGGRPVGLMDTGGYQEGLLELAPGDLVALYSDGVSEANDRQENEFGMERLERTLLHHASSPAQDLVAALFADVDTFAEGAPQYDDMTVLVLQRTG